MTAVSKLPSNHTLEQFQKYLTARNMSDNTIYVYRYAVSQFYHLYPQLTSRNLQLYKVYLLEHYRPQTVNLRIRALNCFMEYRKSAITPVPMIKIQQKMYLDKIISQADYEYLKIRLAKNEEYTYYFIVRLIAATGVRVSELLTFQVEDVLKGYKDIYSKGNKMRRIFVPSCLRSELLAMAGFPLPQKGASFSEPFWFPALPCRHTRPDEGFCRFSIIWTRTSCILTPSAIGLQKILLRNAGISHCCPICLDTRASKPPGSTCAGPARSSRVLSIRWLTGERRRYG